MTDRTKWSERVYLMKKHALLIFLGIVQTFSFAANAAAAPQAGQYTEPAGVPRRHQQGRAVGDGAEPDRDRHLAVEPRHEQHREHLLSLRGTVDGRDPQGRFR